MTTAEKLNTVYDAFNGIKDAITEKGGTPGASITEYPLNILDLPSGGGGDEVAALISGGDLGDFTVPAEVTSLKLYAFYYNKLGTITLPNITTISSNCFNYATINKLVAPNVTTLSSTCFGLADIKEIELPLLKTIGTAIFGNITSVKGEDYDGCRYRAGFLLYVVTRKATHTIKEGTKYIVGNVFLNDTVLTSLDLPEGVEIIGESAFSGCTKLNISLPSTLKYINLLAFKDSGLTEIILPNNTELGNGVFNSCKSLTSVDASSVASIGSNLFDGCTALPEIYLPNATSIGAYAFLKCNKLKVINFGNTLTTVPTLSNTNAFYYVGNDGKASALGSYHIIVPDALYDEWITKTNWSSTVNYIINNTIKYSDALAQGIITE